MGAADVIVGEIPPKIRRISAATTSTILITGIFEKGPIGKATFTAGPEDLATIFGGPIAGGLSQKAMQTYYANGGRAAWIIRTAHYTDITDPSTLTSVAATGTLDDRLPNSGIKAAGSVSVTSNAIDEYVAGQGSIEVIDNAFEVSDAVIVNGVSFEFTTDWAAGIDTDASAQAIADAINLSANVAIDGVLTASIDPLNASRILIIADVKGAPGNSITLAEIDGATDNFTLSGATLTGGLDGDSLTVDGTTLRFGIEIIVGASGAATATAIAAAIDAIGSVDAVVDGSNAVKVNITASAVGVAGNSIVLTKVDPDDDLTLTPLTGTLAGGQDTDTEDALDVELTDDGVFGNAWKIRISAASNGLADHFDIALLSASSQTLDSFVDVNLIPASDDYVETRVNGQSKKLFSATDLFSSNTAGDNHLPALGDHTLSGGDDGLTGISDLDFIGDQAAKTGLQAAREQEGQFAMSACPDRTTVAVQSAGAALAEELNFFWQYDLPAGLDSQGAVDFRASNGYSSEYGEVNWPNVVLLDTTAGLPSGSTIIVPQSCATMGLKVATDLAPGKGVAKAAAGINDGRIVGITDLETNETKFKANRALLFDNYINPIWVERGIGPYLDGAKLATPNGLVGTTPERRTFLFVENSVEAGIKFAKHEPIDTPLFNALNSTTTVFLTQFWRQGGLKGSVAAEAFTVNTDSGAGTINPPSEAEAFRVNMEVGLATKKPGFFIFATFTVDQRELEAEIA